MRCPIVDTGAFIGSGTREGIKFTSIAKEEWNLPCNTWNTANYGTDCWTSDTIELTGPCVDEGTRVRWFSIKLEPSSTIFKRSHRLSFTYSFDVQLRTQVHLLDQEAETHSSLQV